MPLEENSDVTPTFARLTDVKNELTRLRNHLTPVLSSQPKAEKAIGKAPAATGLLAEIEEIYAIVAGINDDLYL